MPSFYDRVAETSVSTGTGNLILQGAVVGYRRWFDAAGIGTRVYYVIEHPELPEFEIGEGYLSDATTFVRDIVLHSSNDDELVAFTSGTKTVFSDVPSDAIQFGGSTYTHNQSSSSAVWTITHNLNRFPSVTVIDSSGRMVMGQVDYVSSNALTVTFSAAFSGKAYLN